MWRLGCLENAASRGFAGGDGRRKVQLRVGNCATLRYASVTGPVCEYAIFRNLRGPRSKFACFRAERHTKTPYSALLRSQILDRVGLAMATFCALPCIGDRGLADMNARVQEFGAPGLLVWMS